MKIGSIFSYKFWTSFAGFTVLSLIFGLAYKQDPIYKSPENQNTKYLHGLAEAGFGFLNEDWTANTIDPLPAFTFLVKITYQISHSEYLFYLYYLIIFAIYLWSIVALLDYLYALKKHLLKYSIYLIFFIFFYTIHIKVFGFDTVQIFHYGLAEQYILGPVFQPCNFGVFLILSIYTFLVGRYFWAVAFLTLAATFHPTYIPSAAILTLSYLVVTFKKEKNIIKPFQIGVLSLLLVLPVFSYMHFTFTPTTPELASQAEDIIVNYRIPHHSHPEIWLNDKNDGAYIKIFWMLLALYIVRKKEIFLLLFVPFATAASLTIAQLFIDNDTLAFIAPWRVSSFLVPISTAIILERVISFIFQKNQKYFERNYNLIWRSIVIVFIAALVAGGLLQLDKFQVNDKSIAMLDFVKQNKQSGQIYLVPTDTRDLTKFRLYTGVPILINRKSHPYKDVEVVEWYNRVEMANKFYANDRNSCSTLHNLVKKYNITHAVLEKEQFNLQCDLLSQKLYKDEKYAVYDLQS